MRRFEKELLSFLDTNYGPTLRKLAEKQAIDDALRAEMLEALDAFKERFTPTTEASAAAAPAAESKKDSGDAATKASGDKAPAPAPAAAH